MKQWANILDRIPIRYRSPHVVLRACLGTIMFILFVLIAIEVLSPEDGLATGETFVPDALGDRHDARRRESVSDRLHVVQDRQLFEPSVPLPSRGMAKQSVDRIKHMVSLHGIMLRNDERVAYIKVQGLGLRAFREGDSVDEMFKVTLIERDRVELDIVGERVILEM
jgi:hypothetical protein